MTRSRRISSEQPVQGELLGAAPSASASAPAPARSDYDAAPRRAAATPGATAESAVSISTLTQTAKSVLEGAFQPLWIRGEVTNFTAHRNGHWYFTLRDKEAQLKGVVWKGDQRGIPASPDEGMEVAAYGQLSMYAARGEVQFVVKRMEAAGEGLWRKALELTRARLEAEGLLDPRRKRALPRFPRRIAVITSRDGAALHDIVSVARRRSPATEIVVVPARVQGEGAVDELIAALERVGRWGDCDLVIIGRGGGSREDLWCFNDEALARAIVASPIPTISAVGHEVDLSIADLVADFRAATPSAAAEAAVPETAALIALVEQVGEQIRASMTRRITRGRHLLRSAARHMSLVARGLTERRRARLQEGAARLQALSPLATLARGYAVARDDDGAALLSATQFTPGAPFRLVLRDGQVRATVRDVTLGPPAGGAEDAT